MAADGNVPFKRTWGHNLLFVLSFLMLAAGIVLALYCGVKLAGVMSLGDEIAQAVALVTMIYGLGLCLGISMLIPAIVGIVTGLRSRRGTVALFLAGVAVFLDIVFVIVMIAAYGATVFGGLMYGVALLVLPVLYGIAALRIRKG